LFIIGGRFTEEERRNYNLLRKVIFNEEVLGYTTVVRTKFEDFRDKEECSRDIKELINESEELAEVIRSCNKVVHVNNPPVPKISGREDEDEREEKISEQKIIKNKRSKSREKLLNHLKTCQEFYNGEVLEEFRKAISEFNSLVEEIDKETFKGILAINKNSNKTNDFSLNREELIRVLENHKKSFVDYMNRQNESSSIKSISNRMIIAGTASHLVNFFVFKGSYPDSLLLRINDGLVVTGSLVSVFQDLLVGNAKYDSFCSFFQEVLTEDEKINNELFLSLKDLINFNNEFRKEKVPSVVSKFDSSKFKELEIDKQKIEVVNRVIRNLVVISSIDSEIKEIKKKEFNCSERNNLLRIFLRGSLMSVYDYFAVRGEAHGFLSSINNSIGELNNELAI